MNLNPVDLNKIAEKFETSNYDTCLETVVERVYNSAVGNATNGIKTTTVQVAYTHLPQFYKGRYVNQETISYFDNFVKEVRNEFLCDVVKKLKPLLINASVYYFCESGLYFIKVIA